MNRIRTALKSYASRYVEAMAYVDPTGFGYYAPDPIPDARDARRADDADTARVADARRQPTAVAA
jgi:hypothetical protein